MPDAIQPTRLTSPRRSRMLVAVMLLGGLLVAGCGAGSSNPAASPAGGASISVSSGTRSHPTTSRHGSGPLAYAECMRANGVPNFPDPQPGGGFNLGAGINPSSPAFQAAEARCQKLTAVGAVGGLLAPGAQTHPSPQTLTKLRRIAVCMRAHDVPQFPDPRMSIPSKLSPGEYQEITNFDGGILLFPATINLRAPAYRQALAICGAPPLGLHH